MEVINISKNYVREYYNGDIQKAIKAKDGVIITEHNIINAFCGENKSATLNEAIKRFKRFIEDNKPNTYFYDLEKEMFL